MKSLVIILATILSVNNFAEAGVTGRAVREAMKRSAKDFRPVIGETDIFNSLTKAAKRAESNQIGPRTAITNVNLQSTPHFSAHFAVNKRTDTVILSLEVKDLNQKQISRISNFVSGQSWRQHGNFGAHVEGLEISSTSYKIEMEFTNLMKFSDEEISDINLSNIKDIKDLVDTTIKMAAKTGDSGEKMSSFLSRKAATQQLSLGVR